MLKTCKYSVAYTGELQEKTLLREGQGTYRYKNSFFKYQGEWKQGKKHGMGIFTLGDGSSYEGNFLNGEMTGIGLRRWADGSTYSGSFKFGEMEGEGLYISNTGEKYEGTMKNNQRHGDGELTKASGDVYQGEFHTNRPHGKGTEYLASGEVYTGDFIRGVRQGQGEMTYLGGQKYQGSWVNGGKHGEGVFEDSKTGYTYTGKWENDTPISTAKTIVAVDCELEVNEQTGNRTMEGKTGEEIMEIKFMCTGNLPDKILNEEGEEDVEAMAALPPLEPVLNEQGRVLKVSACRVTIVEEEIVSNSKEVEEKEDGKEEKEVQTVTKIVRTPVCLLVLNEELEQLSEELSSQTESPELSEDGSMEKVSPPPTVIDVPCEGGYGVLSGYSVRPNIEEGTYELTVTEGNGFDTTTTQILGKLNVVRFELNIILGKSGGKKKKKKK